MKYSKHEDEKKHIIIINRYFPPNHSITGEFAFELASYLKENLPNNYIITSLSIDIDYNSLSIMDLDNKNNGIKSIFLKPFRFSKIKKANKIKRFIANILEGRKLIKKSIKLKADIVITLTDPPLMNFWSALLLKKHNIYWIYWTMDIYPDAFFAAGLISKKNLIYKYINKKILKQSPDFVIALGKLQEKYLEQKYGKNLNHIILPCIIHNSNKNNKLPLWKEKNKDLIYFAYVGNIGEAHSSEFLIQFIESLQYKKHRIILSLYGAKAKKVLNKIKKQQELIIKLDFLPKEEMHFIDIYLVSLLPKWNNICVPSKALSAICAGSPILFNGDKNCDTYQMLKQALWLIHYQKNENYVKQINNFLNSLDKNNILIKRKYAKKLAKELINHKEKSLEKFKSLITNI